MSTLIRDLRYAVRKLAGNPGVTATAVLSLALAIGPNTFLFSLLNTMFLRPWPVRNDHELVDISIQTAKGPGSVSYPDFLDYRKLNHVFTGMIAWEGGGGLLTWNGQREIVSRQGVSRDFFEVLGIHLTLGAGFGAAPGGPDLPVVLSHGLWEREFGGDPGVVGQSVVFDGRSCTVVGVAPKNFTGLHWLVPADLWEPIDGRADANLLSRDRGRFLLLGRLRSGVTFQQAEAEMNIITARLAESYPETNQGRRIVFSQESSGRGRRGALLSFIVLGLVGLVLLVASANVANLLLAQADARRRETAIRLAIGASRRHLVRQLLTEGLVISLLAGGLGLALGRLLVLGVPAIKPPIPLPLNFEFDLDGRVLLYTLALSVATTMLFALAPALNATRGDLTPALKNEAGLVTLGRRGLKLRSVLVVSQIAVSAFLLVMGGLLLRSYWKTFDIATGFDERKDMLLLFVGSRAAVDYQALAERIETIPGVERASFSRHFPMSGSGVVRQEVIVPGLETPPDEPALSIRYNVVGLRYFGTMGTRILRGRGFERSDGPDASRVTVINQTMARRYWPNGEAIDKWIEIAGEPHRIIGVAEDGRYDSLRESPQPFLYLPYAQRNRVGEAMLLVDTAVKPASLAPTIRTELQRVAPELVLLQTVTLREQMRIARYFEEMGTGLVGAAGALAIFLSVVGLFGVVSSNTNLRRREIGIRMAMGATSRRVMRMILAYGLRLVLLGLPFGFAAALVVSHGMASLLYGIQPTDAASFLGASVLIMILAVAACCSPARNAMKAEPAAALRCD